jgi:hypothetical protein
MSIVNQGRRSASPEERNISGLRTGSWLVKNEHRCTLELSCNNNVGNDACVPGKMIGLPAGSNKQRERPVKDASRKATAVIANGLLAVQCSDEGGTPVSNNTSECMGRLIASAGMERQIVGS